METFGFPPQFPAEQSVEPEEKADNPKMPTDKAKGKKVIYLSILRKTKCHFFFYFSKFPHEHKYSSLGIVTLIIMANWVHLSFVIVCLFRFQCFK